MCGITVVYNKNGVEGDKIRSQHQHRGPDCSNELKVPFAQFIHDRLSINDLSAHGNQPLIGCSKAILVHNGEIYNKEEIKKSLKNQHRFEGDSDSEIILHLYEEEGIEAISQLDGVYFFALLDRSEILVARDPFGVKPGYYGQDQFGNFYFSSEAKSIAEYTIEVKEFPPGHYFTNDGGFHRFYNPSWSNLIPNRKPDKAKVRDLLEKAVVKRLMSDVEIAGFLSGGLDSSLICAIAAKELKKRGRPFKTFSIGIEEDGEDHKFAEKVANFIGSDHHKINFTPEEAIDFIPKVISHLESYDLTTIRSGIPLYILSFVAAKKFNLKVVLCGEGSDEALGGYLYFKNAVNSEAFHKECVERLFNLHTSDVLRVDKCTMANSLEARVPFLDLDLIEYIMNMNPKCKMHQGQDDNPRGIEKNILRLAFDDQLIPDEVLWRQKEQFSDGVGYSWIDHLTLYASKQVSDAEFSGRFEKYPHNTPRNKEEYFYRKVYHQFFDKRKTKTLTLPWIPKWQDNNDPSGRHCNNHISTQ